MLLSGRCRSFVARYCWDQEDPWAAILSWLMRRDERLPFTFQCCTHSLALSHAYLSYVQLVIVEAMTVRAPAQSQQIGEGRRRSNLRIYQAISQLGQPAYNLSLLSPCVGRVVCLSGPPHRDQVFRLFPYRLSLQGASASDLPALKRLFEAHLTLWRATKEDTQRSGIKQCKSGKIG